MEPRAAQASFRHEWDGAALYDGIAAVERDPNLAEVYRRLAEVERRHAARWARELEDAGVPVPARHPSLRVRILIWLARRFGPAWVLPSLAEVEASDGTAYAAHRRRS